MSMRIQNEKRFFPSFSLQFEPRDYSAFRLSTFYVPVVHARSDVPQTGQAMIKRRGLYSMSAVKASSSYPFGFFLKQRNYRVDAECICYPEILPQREIDFSVIDFQGTNERPERGLGHDLYTIRDYVPSDSARHVHWKASAKTSMLKTREYAT